MLGTYRFQYASNKLVTGKSCNFESKNVLKDVGTFRKIIFFVLERSVNFSRTGILVDGLVSKDCVTFTLVSIICMLEL